MKRIVLLILVAIAAFMFTSYGQGVNIIDAGNSTVKNLDSAGVFTGKAKDLILGGNWSTVSVFISSDKSSALNGVKIYFGADSTKWKDSITATVTANICTTLYSPIYARYYKVKYTNDTAAATSFMITSILHEQSVNRFAADTINARANLILQELSKADSRQMVVKLDSLGSTATDTVKNFWFNSGTYNKYQKAYFTLFDSAGVTDTFYVQRYDTLSPFNAWTNVQVAYKDWSTQTITSSVTGQYGFAGGFVVIPGAGLTKTYTIEEDYPRQYRIWVSKYATRSNRRIFIKWTAKQL